MVLVLSCAQVGSFFLGLQSRFCRSMPFTTAQDDRRIQVLWQGQVRNVAAGITINGVTTLILSPHGAVVVCSA